MLVKTLHMKQDLFTMAIKRKTKGIYGNTSLTEIKELKEEGIETEIIPWINDNEN